MKLPDEGDLITINFQFMTDDNKQQKLSESTEPTIAKPMLSVRACEGNCTETHGSHRGEVKEVIVTGNGWQKTTFFYCENAIDEDRERGFNVDAVA